MLIKIYLSYKYNNLYFFLNFIHFTSFFFQNLLNVLWKNKIEGTPILKLEMVKRQRIHQKLDKNFVKKIRQKKLRQKNSSKKFFKKIRLKISSKKFVKNIRQKNLSKKFVKNICQKNSSKKFVKNIRQKYSSKKFVKKGTPK